MKTNGSEFIYSSRLLSVADIKGCLRSGSSFDASCSWLAHGFLELELVLRQLHGSLNENDLSFPVGLQLNHDRSITLNCVPC